MKIEKRATRSKENQEEWITYAFVPETEEEKRMLGTLRHHFFYGSTEKKTFPHYAGITSENNFVTSLMLEMKKF